LICREPGASLEIRSRAPRRRGHASARARRATTLTECHGENSRYRAIVDVAPKEASDLIARRVHGRNPPSLALCGSTTRHVVRQASGPVLTLDREVADAARRRPPSAENCERARQASHAIGASRRSGERERVQGSSRGGRCQSSTTERRLPSVDYGASGNLSGASSRSPQTLYKDLYDDPINEVFADHIRKVRSSREPQGHLVVLRAARPRCAAAR
jgi:nucleotide-binding universal stress UspA family protein